MERNQKVLALALTFALLLYVSPYIVNPVFADGAPPSCSLTSVDFGPPIVVHLTILVSNPPFSVGISPPFDQASIKLLGGGLASLDITMLAGQTTPFTLSLAVTDVAGLQATCNLNIAPTTSVPEFGSLYGAIALTAVAYLGLSLLRARRTTITTAPE